MNSYIREFLLQDLWRSGGAELIPYYDEVAGVHIICCRDDGDAVLMNLFIIF